MFGASRSKILSLFLVCVSVAPTLAHAKPFKTAMIFSGNGLNTAMFLGMLEAARAQGHAPDLIIGVCGGSVATSIASIYPGSARQQMDLMSSEKMLGFYRQFKPSDQDNTSGLFSLFPSVFGSAIRGRIPDFFNQYLFKTPKAFPTEEFSAPWVRSDHASIVLTTRMLFKPKNVGIKIGAQQIYRQTYLTDAETGKLLVNRPSDLQPQLAAITGHTYLDAKTDLRTDWHLDESIRASVSDPFIFQPFLKDGYYYTAGSIDLYPIELAKSLADEVIMNSGEYFPAIQEKLYSISFGFKDRKRVQQMMRKTKAVDYWVDFGGSPEDLKFSLGVNAHQPNGDLDLSNIRLDTELPKNAADFTTLNERQFTFGYRRTVQAFHKPRYDQEHLVITPKPTPIPFPAH